MQIEKTKRIVEAVLFAAGKPLTVLQLDEVFDQGEGEDRPNRDDIRQALKELQEEYDGKGVELRQVASGFRFQVPQGFEPWIARLYDERPPRYSRALLETLSIIAYRQPVTRGEIEDIRGVAVSTHITRTLQEREWIRVLGHKDVPGKPAMFGTTREFLDYFNLKNLNDLPSLAELRDLESFHPQLELGETSGATEVVEQATALEDTDDSLVPAVELGPVEESDEISAPVEELSASVDEADIETIS
jgi:segregation and condensation protein B